MRAWEVENSLAVLLERLPAEDLGEQVRRVLVGRDVLDRDDAWAVMSVSSMIPAVGLSCAGFHPWNSDPG